MPAYGSLQNMTAQSPKDITPVVGMGATEILYTDRRPYTIIWVSPKGDRIRVQEDKAVRTDDNGMSECQSYRFEPDPEGRIVEVRKTKTGQWGKQSKFVVGHRSYYYDYSF